MDDAVWNHAVFSKNRDRLLTSDVAQRFFAEVNKQAKRFMSDEHFTVDGTLATDARLGVIPRGAPTPIITGQNCAANRF